MILTISKIKYFASIPLEFDCNLTLSTLSQTREEILTFCFIILYFLKSNLYVSMKHLFFSYLSSFEKGSLQDSCPLSASIMNFKFSTSISKLASLQFPSSTPFHSKLSFPWSSFIIVLLRNFVIEGVACQLPSS